MVFIPDILLLLLGEVTDTVGDLVSAAVTVTFFGPFIVTTQVWPDVKSQPVQPLTVLPETNEAVKVTTVPWAYSWVQSVPQLIPKGLDLIVVTPVPDLVTVNTDRALKFAMTVLLAFILIVHVGPVAESQPVQITKALPAAGTAVSVMSVPGV